jgi:hypothetical protein
MRLAWLKRPKIICAPSYADISSRANTTRGLNFDHKIKANAHKGDMRIGKTPKKLASICCPQCRETKADTLKATEANRRRGPGTREKVRSKRTNLEGNTHAQLINVSQFPVYLFLSQLEKTLVPSYYCLYSLFNKIRDKGKIVSAGY